MLSTKDHSKTTNQVPKQAVANMLFHENTVVGAGTADAIGRVEREADLFPDQSFRRVASDVETWGKQGQNRCPTSKELFPKPEKLSSTNSVATSSTKSVGSLTSSSSRSAVRRSVRSGSEELRRSISSHEKQKKVYLWDLDDNDCDDDAVDDDWSREESPLVQDEFPTTRSDASMAFEVHDPLAPPHLESVVSEGSNSRRIDAFEEEKEDEYEYSNGKKKKNPILAPCHLVASLVGHTGVVLNETFDSVRDWIEETKTSLEAKQRQQQQDLDNWRARMDAHRQEQEEAQRQQEEQYRGLVESRKIWSTMLELGRLRASEGRHLDALLLWDDALAIQLSLPDCPYEDIATTLNLVGVVLSDKGLDDFVAYDALDVALMIRQYRAGLGALETADVVNNLWVHLHNVNQRANMPVEELMSDRRRKRMLLGMNSNSFRGLANEAA